MHALGLVKVVQAHKQLVLCCQRERVFLLLFGVHTIQTCTGGWILMERMGVKVRMRVMKIQTLWYFCPLSPAMAVAMVGGLFCTVLPNPQTSNQT